MSDIIGIGANVYDTLFLVPDYPAEDSKLRAEETRESGGGPVATGLAAAAKLGASAAYCGVLADDVGGRFLLGDMERRGIDTACVESKAGCRSFQSCIWLSRASATRTCVFHKGDLPPLELGGAELDAVGSAKVLMVDGNELDAAVCAAKHARAHGVKVLYDAGGLYDGIDRLLPLADILIPSEEFALAVTGEKSAEAAASALMAKYRPELAIVTCGKTGGWLCVPGRAAEQYPAFPVEAVDSNGAGDVFHGAFAFAATRGLDARQCCIFSSAVSALKCTKIGARDGVPELTETIQFLKERGYDEFEKILGS